ncbi:MAG: Holliday junction resolvase RuvX [Phycisphaerales bacterium]|nr:Holliday junction resolvase RuvX [Phycisphaerales bacterium]
MGRYAGIDYGSRRIGIATAEDPVRIAFPTAAIPGVNDPGRDARALLRWCENHPVDEFVVGLPVNMDGTPGPQALRCEKFAEFLRRASGRPVHMQDERLTSFAADDALRSAGHTPADRRAARRSGQRDALAAQVILREWLDRNPPHAPPPTFPSPTE